MAPEATAYAARRCDSYAGLAAPYRFVTRQRIVTDVAITGAAAVARVERSERRARERTELGQCQRHEARGTRIARLFSQGDEHEHDE
jgi:hypothetical protein